MLTREEILNEPAGRKLDAWVAEKVMGLPVTAKKKRFEYVHIAPFSTDISAAWEVVEKMQQTKFVRVQCDNGDYWCKIGGEILGVKAQGDTAPLAICRAALLAVIDT